MAFALTFILVAAPRIAEPQLLVGSTPVTGPVGSSVVSLAKSGNTVYMGGSFDYVGPLTGTFARIDAGTGIVDATVPRIPGFSVDAMAPDGAGGWYIAGSNIRPDGTTTAGVAHVLADLSVDPAWTASVGNVRAIAVSGSSVFIGGSFSSVSGQPRASLAALDASTGALLPFNAGNAVQAVHALVASGSTLYVGGRFIVIGGEARQNLAAVDASTGTALPWVADADATVKALLLDGSTLYVGGHFTGLAGFVRNHLGAVDATTAALSGWNPNANSYVLALALSGGTLYAGGAFTTVGIQARDRIAAISASTGLPSSSWNPGADGEVNALATSGGAVYAGGRFTNLGGQVRVRIGAVDATTGLPTAWNPGASDFVNVIVASGSSVFVGGSFNSVGGQARSRLAAFDATTGQVTAWNPSPNSTVAAIATDGTTVWVGGPFTSVGGQARNYLAALSATTGLATSWNPDPNGSVHELALSGGAIYVGGDFTNISNKSRPYVAQVNTANDKATDWNPIADAYVHRILPVAGSVYVIGGFANIGGQPRVRVAALSPATGQAITTWDAAPNISGTFGGFHALAADGTTLYLSGTFTAIGGALRRYVAGVDLVTATATAFDPNPNLIGPYQIAVHGSHVYAVVDFNGQPVSIGGQPRFGLAELQLPGGLATPWVSPFLQASAGEGALLLDGTVLYMGSNCVIKAADGSWRRNLAAFDLSIPVGVGPRASRPGVDLALGPNPSRGPTLIRLALPVGSRVGVRILDLQGREVARLLDRWLPAGEHDVRWDGTRTDRSVSAGVFFVRVDAAGVVLQEKLVVIP